MNPRVELVKPLPEFKLLLTFTNGENRVFDVSPYLDKGIFSNLRDNSIFQAVRIFNGTVLWPGDLDFCPDTLYEQSKRYGS